MAMTYTAPGVYVEEVSSGNKPIQGVGTSTAGFIGAVSSHVKMPQKPDGSGAYTVHTDTNKPQPVNSWLEFSQKFGDGIQLGNQYLAHAVYGFFNNGGTRCWVAPIAAETASHATLTLRTVSGGSGLELVAKEAGVEGNDINIQVRVKTFTLTVTGTGGGSVTAQTLATIASAVTNSNALKTLISVTVESGATASPTSFPLPLETGTVPASGPLAISGHDTPKDSATTVMNITSLNSAEHTVSITPETYEVIVTPKNPANKTTIESTTFPAKNASKDVGTNLISVTTKTSTPVKLATGSWNLARGELVTDTPLGNYAANVESALEAFEYIDEIALVVAPLSPNSADVGNSLPQVHSHLIDHCEKMQDRFAILDCQQDKTGDTVAKPSSPSSYAGFYFPWVKVPDPMGRAGATIAVPPSGHIAGVYARVDGERGVFKAPANEVIRGAMAVGATITKTQLGNLNAQGVNCIRGFRDGVKIWGARTLATGSNPEFQYINVRRLFLYVRESIDEGTQWVVFEPNTHELWAKIRRNVTAFLTNTWHAGALFGNTANEAFYVRCDEHTNPPEVRDLGRVVTEIGIAPVKPAEFVIFHIQQWAGPPTS